MLDVASQLAAAYAPTTAATNINTTNYVNRLTPMDDGAGNPIYWYTKCEAAPTSSGSATLLFQLIGNPSDPTFSSGNVVVLQTPVSGTAAAYSTIVANQILTRMVVPRVPTSTVTNETSLTLKSGLLQYYALAVIIGTAALTGGSFSSWLTTRPPVSDNLAYPWGVTFP
jgi:hypothetical protein